ncbi:tRNA uridine-5-carboxymethylaminomethyl(34) synthesis GTPase MnmE [Candidatus Profftella armatura (Diaphorina cf. continua)]|uniref:tRNA modification GTPase MnmE n=1 Tax=Candidatus Profftella armatura (Diaphorina cf. continua) TaxID=2661583 RepID=A0A7R6W100_9PROT|nr:tRNA uridine-5-carboxymethylaminomethyl(34) synthesis GTPase MnmE [Candidatus Profftella armatura (Diaphorina cf. continua)]BCG49720.1 tRNA uridine-5-carboxymethylaminomethyl(34) synthesis GTPase MnmE [Candidatus Profftella armatura (Diaphorina cf. continua)]
MLIKNSPIIGIATPPGRGGVGIIRLSGKNLWSIVEIVCKKTQKQLKPRYATYSSFFCKNNNILDQGLVIYFKAPHSYTGEDVIELHGHGGPIILRMLLSSCLEIGKSIGLRLAMPGEFTKRAFLNNKLDLTQVEAIIDLINASTEAAAKSAMISLSGRFSQLINILLEKLINLRTLIEFSFDFPEENQEFILNKTDIFNKLIQIKKKLLKIIQQGKKGALIRDGLNVVLIGQPNVGKSSLFNALVGSDIAIVTSIAGTTRDKVTETIQINEILLKIIDTAGISDVNNKIKKNIDEVEKIGIERTWVELKNSDIIIYVQDARYNEHTNFDKKIIKNFPINIPVIYVWNKIDYSGHKKNINYKNKIANIYLSASKGVGIDLLRNTLLNIIEKFYQTIESSPYLARERHIRTLSEANYYLSCAIKITNQSEKNFEKNLELIAEDLRFCHEKLSSIIGKSITNDLLDNIFSQFCIGK